MKTINDELLNTFLPKCGKLKWKQEFIQDLCTSNNAQLLESVLSAQQPDSYDGDFTDRGDWMARVSLQILEYKLKLDGWLPNE